ncbi:MAG TPA: anthranilate synthase component I family protein [Nocardioidaceae bacterium]|jgi:para-aminobenzoate synthetase
MTVEPLPWVEPEDFVVAHVAGRDRAFWLDGAGSRPWSGRRSFVGWLRPDDLSLTYDARTTTVMACRAGSAHPVGSDIFAAVQQLTPVVAHPGAGWTGYFGYAARPDLPARLDDGGAFRDGAAPDSCWMRADRMVAFDHEHHTVTAVGDDAWRAEVADLLCRTATAHPATARPEAADVQTLDRGRYAEAFVRVQSELRRGNSYEANLTYRSQVVSSLDALSAYRRLRRINPAPYAAYFTHHGVSLLSSSPERFARIEPDGWLETRPIKGTTPRHEDADADVEAAHRLRRDPKFRGENLMIVDLLRNDLSIVCDVGTVEVADLMHVESYATVHQLVTTIRGRLRGDVRPVQAISALFPGGSMTGAPKLRTMQIIAEVETTPRGAYSGALGWIGDDGRADLGIVIRSLVHRDGIYTLGTGGGITVRSDCDEEYAESQWKLSAMLAALRPDSAG